MSVNYECFDMRLDLIGAGARAGRGGEAFRVLVRVPVVPVHLIERPFISMALFYDYPVLIGTKDM